ncbi:helix-turn-helix domain-containing protein [Actinosynnema sp. NPDC023794]
MVEVARSTRDRVRLRRAGIVPASAQGRGVTGIAQLFAASPGYVREVIHAFNDTGFAALDPRWSGGRPRKFTPSARGLICQTARSDPSPLGQPFTTWSLAELVAYLAEHRRLLISTETVAPGAARGWCQPAGHQDLEAESGSGLCREDGPRPGS